MEKVDIKKMFLVLCGFTICAVLITSLLIFLKINRLSTNYKDNENAFNIEIVGTKKNQKYNQNDLKIINENVKYKELEYQSLRISGLKNKEIENKINAEFADVENNFRERVLAASGENSNMYLTSYVNANYSNILSVSFYASKSNSNYRNEINIHKFLNYDLTTGNQIKIEDIFVPNVDIDLLVQNYIYQEKLHEKFSESNIFFNSEYWEDGKLNYLVGEIDELDFMNEFLKYKNSDKNFYITPTGVNIRYSDDYNTGNVFIYFKKYLDKIVIYNKYVSTENIFEFENIGLKDLYVCSDVVLYADNSYYIIEDVAPNFRIDARVNMLYGSGYENSNLYQNAIESVKEEIKKKKEEFTKKSKENANNYYLLEMVYTVDDFDPTWWSTTYDSQSSSDKFIINKQECSYEMSKEDFENWFEDKMISSYTSENYTMDYQMNIVLYEEEKQKCNFAEENKGTIYQISNGKITENIEDILVEGVDYISIIADYLEKYNGISRDQTEEIIKNHEYHLEKYGIVFDGLYIYMGWYEFKQSDFS